MDEKVLDVGPPKSPIFTKGDPVSNTVDEAVPQLQPVDVQDPKSWPFWTKVFHTLTLAMFGFAITFGTSVYTPGIGAVAQHFHVSREVAVLGLSLYSEGLALGPIVGAPISEATGRKGVYLITGPIFMLFILGAGLAQNIETFVVCRLLAGVFGGPSLAIAAGSVADLWDMQSGGAVASILLVSTFFMGPSLGPLIGGFTFEDRRSWRWLMWTVLIACAPAVLLTLLTKETSLKHIQQREAKKRGVAPPPRPPVKQALKMLFVVTLFRPLKMLVREPIVTAWALYHSFIFGVLFGFFGSYYYVFQTVYHFTLSQVGLTFLGVFIGIITSIFAFILIDKVIYQKKRLQYADGKPPPEERLYVCMLGALLMPISLFWFAWTSRADIHWMSPVAAGIPFGCATMCLFVGGITYMMDTYGPLYTASAMAANGLLRYTFGAVFPLFVTQMYERLGIPWATSLLGFVSLGLLPIPFVLYKFGPALRSRSIFVGFTR